MYIQSIQNSNVSMSGVNFRGKNKPNIFKRAKNYIEKKIINAVPKHTFDDTNKVNKWDKINTWISNPAQNRAITGIAGVILQPFIDSLNHRVDDETREVSVNRTLAKCIIAPTAGILFARGPVQKIVENMTSINGKGKYSKALIPKSLQDAIKRKGLTKKIEASLGRYKCALSTIMALTITVFTNFLIDAPLTTFFTNLLNERSAKKRKRKEVINNEKSISNNFRVDV